MAIIYKVKSVETIYNAMKNYMIGLGSTITNFNVGSRIRTLLEAIAITNHKTEFDFNQAIKTAIPISIFNSFNFAKFPGIASNGHLEFSRSSAAAEDYTIVIGTTINLDGVYYETTEEGYILTGNTSSGQINAKCSITGTIGNISINAIDVQSGKGTFLNQPAGVEQCTNPTSFTGGQDEETDEARIERFSLYINALTRSTVKGLEYGALSVSGVVSVTVIENDPDPGFIKIYADDGSGSITPAIQTEIQKVIDGDLIDPLNYPGYRAAGIQVTVLAPQVVPISILIVVKVLSTNLLSDAEIILNAKTAIEGYVNTLKLGYDVIRASISAAIKNANQDIYDIVVTTPASNVTILQSQVGRINFSSFNVSVTRVTNV